MKILVIHDAGDMRYRYYIGIPDTMLFADAVQKADDVIRGVNASQDLDDPDHQCPEFDKDYFPALIAAGFEGVDWVEATEMI
jgi:hypothetical protein